jgi:hypothetical protein
MPRFALRTSRFGCAALLLGVSALPLANAQQRDFLAVGTPLPKMPADPQIAAALTKVSAARIQANIEKLVSFKTRNTLSSMETDLAPGTGIAAATEYIKSQFEEYSRACGGCLEIKVDEFTADPLPGPNPRIAKPTILRNVYAILRGTDPVQAKRMYLVSGHYDTMETDVMNDHDPAPGANDDASGTAVSMENARVLSQYKFPATLVFVTVAGEEQGLVGSAHLAKLAKSEGWQLEGVLNNDIVGGNTTPGDSLQDKTAVRVFSQGILPTMPVAEIKALLQIGADSDTASRELAREIAEAGRTYFAPAVRKTAYGKFAPVMEMRLDRFNRGGDHRSFNDQGFAAVRFTEWREDFHHQHQTPRMENGVQYGDLLQFDDFSYIAQVARLNMATLATMASSPGLPQKVIVTTPAYHNDTTLKWEAPAGAPASTHYEIVWRETAAPDWEYTVNAARFADPAQGIYAATLPVSKDNVFFGVRACDAAEHCSQAVAPLPVGPTGVLGR